MNTNGSHLLSTNYVPHTVLECFTQMIMAPSPIPLSRCCDDTHFADAETEVPDLKNLATVTARKQWQGFAPTLVCRRLLGHEQLLQVETEKRPHGALGQDSLYIEMAFSAWTYHVPDRSKEQLFSQRKMLVTPPPEK